ncbi:dihydrolipoyllysine-residue acetyltransferase [Alcanivorax sp. 1008]|uniref:dihydrolipoyllysine-residue acetyltransferase n=1 Tax=Alcanivorax sp. 1008 TaxID=2816853 RepID=UPI001D6CE17D|nr:dihydrolipoyllysine-residue acetyltransferase [Alcanivorax sp. 1008]MCC1495308.1 dihydrolipoyllysine-residue acetyltransferase [Alcanivorax sp. 1008]
MSMETVRVPDIGSDDAVDVIEVPVKAGDQLEQEATIVVLESDKATVEVPLPKAGKVSKVLVKTGDRVKQGDALLELELSEVEKSKLEEKPEPDSQPAVAKKAPPVAATASKAAGADGELRVPDLGDIDGAEIIELLIKEGDQVNVDQIVAVLESDKASVEIPALASGVLSKLSVKVGDKLKTGDLLGLLSGVSETAARASAAEPQSAPPPTSQDTEQGTPAEPAAAPQSAVKIPELSVASSSQPVHAGPGVRKLARELGVDLAPIKGTGPRKRILQEDVHAWVKQKLAQSQSTVSAGGVLPALPEIDFSRFGDIERVELNKLRKVAAANLHRSWLTIPHVTQHDDADITELEAFRQSENQRLKNEGVKLTMLAFLVRACAVALHKFPRFNSSLTVDGEVLIEKRYVHIGVAVETENGLMVPVLRDADKKGIVQIAAEVSELAAKARNRKLTPADMQGGTFSISSLGGIGGTAFTPIVNWPEVAILGVSKSEMKPRWNGKDFEPRLMLPLSLSYDHRVIDGADAARFITFVNQLLTDMRRALL